MIIRDESGSIAYEDGYVLMGEECIDEATGWEPFYPTKGDVPDDFKKTVIKAIDVGEKMTENKRGVGEGAGAALWGLYGGYLHGTSEKINSKKTKSSYILVIPKRIRIKLHNFYNGPKEYNETAEKMIKAAGFKQADIVDRGIAKGAKYWYKYSPDKKYIYFCMYDSPAAYFLINTQLQIQFRCCDNTEKIRNDLFGKTSTIKESKYDPDDDSDFMNRIHDEKEIDDALRNKNKYNDDDKDLIDLHVAESTKEELDLTKYFSFNPEDNVEDGMLKDPEKEFYRDPVYNKAIMEYFNINDKKTRKVLLSMNEAGQNTVLMNLTSKLYDKIMVKCEDIDYGEIPATKGDITKLSKYEDMKEVISILRDILKEYKQDPSPVDELAVALSNVEARKDLFERAYRYNSELPIAMYCNVVLGIITGISYMIATCIEFVKDPGTENFRIALDRLSYARTKDHMIYNTLKSFNKTCKNGEFDKAMEAVLKAGTKNFGGAAVIGGVAIGILGIFLVLIPVLRELIFMFYYMRMRVSDFFDIQADLLQMNAYNLEANSTLNKHDQKKVMAKQLKYAEKFRKISNTFAIDMKKAEVSSNKAKREDDESKMLIDDIDGIDTGASGSALF